MYQVVVQHGALDDVPGSHLIPKFDDGLRLGGAELVLLRIDKNGLPQVQAQEPIDPQDPWVERALEAADVRIRDEQFSAITSSRCDGCSFRSVCPAQVDGQEVIT
jgi:hypothetical protein